MKGITPDQRQTLYHPLTYEVKRVNVSVYSALSVYTGLEFYVKWDDGIWRVKSPTGTEWNVSDQCDCNCPDFFGGAKKENRFCKHQAVVMAVSIFVEHEKNRRSLKEVRGELKEMFG